MADAPEISWYDPHGVQWALSSPATSPMFVTDAVSGLGAAPITIVADEDPRGGSNVRHIQPKAKTFVLPVWVEGETRAEFLSLWRRFVSAFTSTRRYGPGRLSVTQPDGTTRELLAYYQDGFKEQTGGRHMLSDLAPVTLFIPQPYWRAPTPQIAVRRVATTSGLSFLGPKFPRLSMSATLGRTIITNIGSVEAWPQWTITGPASSIIATSRSTGKSWTLDCVAFRSALVAGEQIVITTQPVTITGPLVNGSTSWAGALNWPDAQLWELIEGPNDIEFQINGSGVAIGGGTSIEVQYYPLFETS